MEALPMPNAEPPNDDLRYLLGELPPESEATASSDTLLLAGEALTTWADKEITPLTPAEQVWDSIALHTGNTRAANTLTPIFMLRLWQAAALLFFAGNLFWFLLFLREPTSDASARDTAATLSPETPAAMSASDAPNTPPPTANGPTPLPNDASPRLQALETRLAAKEDEVETLRDALRDASEEVNSARAAEGRLLAQLGTFFEAIPGKAQTTTIAMAADISPLTQADLVEIASGNRGQRATLSADFASDFAEASTSLPDPAAVFTWQNDLQEGILNLFNLPQLAVGSNYQLWAEHQLTGETVPLGPLESGTSGTVSFVIATEDPNFIPSAIWMTIEPSGETFLWGPGNPNAPPPGGQPGNP